MWETSNSTFATGRREPPALIHTRRQRLFDRIGARVELAAAMGAAFFSPMNFLRLDFFYFTLSDALICLCLLLRLRRGELSFQPFGTVSSIYWFSGLVLLLLGLLLSSIVYGDPIRGLVYTMQYLFAYFVVLLVIAGRSEKQLFLLAKTYVLSIFFMCLHGIYLINVLGERNTGFVSGSGRLTGFVERENECAALIALAVPLLLLLCTSRRLPKIALLALPVLGYGVMLTGSNTGLASFAFVIVAFTAMTFNWKHMVVIAGFGIGVVLAIDQWAREYLPATFQRRVLGALESGDIGQAGSFDHRLELVYEAIDRANHTILLGVGADQYAVTSFLFQPVHNLYLLLWTEGGPFCMVGFIVMIAAGYGPAMTALKRPGGRAAAACAIATISLFLLAVNAFASVYGRFWAMPIALAVSLAYVVSERKTDVEGLQTHPTRT